MNETLIAILVQQEEGIEYLRQALLCMLQGYKGLSMAVADLQQRVQYLESSDPALNSEVILPQEGYLDVAGYVKCRLGHDDLRLASQFGRFCAEAGRSRGLEPEKVTQPGSHWREVNAWPLNFLSEMWNHFHEGTA